MLHTSRLMCTALLLCGCTAIAGLDDLDFSATGGAGPGGNGGGAHGGGGGGAGGGGAGAGGAGACTSLTLQAFEHLGGVGLEYVLGGTVDGAGDFLLTGDFDGELDVGGVTATAEDQDGFLLQRTSAGSWGWRSFLGGAGNQHGVSVAVANSGSIVWAGYFEGSLMDENDAPLPSAGSFDLHLIGLSSAGVTSWVKTYGDASSQRGSTRVALSSDGTIALFGTFESGFVDFGGGATATSSGSYELFLAQLDASGTGIWARSFGSVDVMRREQAEVSVDAAGDIYIAGRIVGDIDMKECGIYTPTGSIEGYAAKFSSAGACIWATFFPPGTGLESQVMGSQLGADGRVTVVGDFAGTLAADGQMLTSQGRDGFMAQLDPSDGAVLSLRRLGGPLDDSAPNVYPHGAGAVVTGHFSDTADIAGCLLTAQGSSDTFVVQLDASGQGVASQQLVGDAGIGRVFSNDATMLMSGHFDGMLSIGGDVLVAPDSFSEGFIATFAP